MSSSGICLDGVVPTPIVQTGNTISASWVNDEGKTETLTGTIAGNSIHFEWQIGQTTHIDFDGTIAGYTISGTFFGTGTDDDPTTGWTFEVSGTFTVTVTP